MSPERSARTRCTHFQGSYFRHRFSHHYDASSLTPFPQRYLRTRKKSWVVVTREGPETPRSELSQHTLHDTSYPSQIPAQTEGLNHNN